jgi:hypothetical protein
MDDDQEEHGRRSVLSILLAPQPTPADHVALSRARAVPTAGAFNTRDFKFRGCPHCPETQAMTATDLDLLLELNPRLESLSACPPPSGR